MLTDCADGIRDMQRIVAVIPVRMASSRFPGKPLAKLHGIPMVEHVFRRARLCSQLDEVYVATCDPEIRDVSEAFGAKVIMTSAAHQRAADRVAEAAEQFPADIVVMIQGDEPMITPEMIQKSLEPFRSNPLTSCVNLVHRITTQQEFIDPNTIKVVADVNGNALYFSRSPIPHVSVEDPTAKFFKQVCVIAFSRQCLQEFSELPSTSLECAESIDILRLIEHGMSVRLVETSIATHSVDTPDDLQLVEQMMSDDQLMRQYLD
jgi:3-deoxy-manno-octulosonate cytidylyltransferase (CMP-KDO synthetase)